MLPCDKGVNPGWHVSCFSVLGSDISITSRTVVEWLETPVGFSTTRVGLEFTQMSKKSRSVSAGATPEDLMMPGKLKCQGNAGEQ